MQKFTRHRLDPNNPNVNNQKRDYFKSAYQFIISVLKTPPRPLVPSPLALGSPWWEDNRLSITGRLDKHWKIRWNEF